MSIKLAIDFDSIWTNIFRLGYGVVLSEPTVAAVDMGTKGELKSVGIEAKKLIGKTGENTKIVFPVFEGEIVNEKVASKMLSVFLKKVGVDGKLFGVEAVVGVPCGATSNMLQLYESVLKQAGINKIHFVEAPILSAMGQRIPLTNSSPVFVIDMAGGTTNIAALSMDGIIAGISVNFGANKISTDIIDYVSDMYGLQVGLQSAEKLKKEIGSLDENDMLSAVINGRDIISGAPRSILIKASDIIEPIKNYYDKIEELARSVLVKLPPEVSAEIRKSGIYVSGVSSEVYGLAKYFKDKFDMKINVSDTSNMSVVLGGGVVVADQLLIKKLSLKTN